MCATHALTQSDINECRVAPRGLLIVTQARHARQQVCVEVPSMGGNATVKKGTPKPVNLTASKAVFNSTTNLQHPMQGNKISTLI